MRGHLHLGLLLVLLAVRVVRVVVARVLGELAVDEERGEQGQSPLSLQLGLRDAEDEQLVVAYPWGSDVEGDPGVGVLAGDDAFCIHLLAGGVEQLEKTRQLDV